MKSKFQSNIWKAIRSQSALEPGAFVHNFDFDRTASTVFGGIFYIAHTRVCEPINIHRRSKWKWDWNRFDSAACTTADWFPCAIREFVLRNIPIKSIIIYGTPDALYFVHFFPSVHTRFREIHTGPISSRHKRNAVRFDNDNDTTGNGKHSGRFHFSARLAFRKALLSINMDYRCRYITSIQLARPLWSHKPLRIIGGVRPWSCKSQVAPNTASVRGRFRTTQCIYSVLVLLMAHILLLFSIFFFPSEN